MSTPPPLSALLFWYDFRPEPLTYGTYCAPTSFIPIKSPEQLAAGAREEATAKVLAVLQEQKPRARKRRLG